MEALRIFKNGLPKELETLREGQIYLFPKLVDGLTEEYVLVAQYISSASGKLIKLSDIRDKRPEVFVIPTTNPDLWGCMVCRLSNCYEIADKGSLLEMLYDIFGIDYSKDSHISMADRYKITPSDCHPERILLSDIVTSPDEEDGKDYTFGGASLEFLTNTALSSNQVSQGILASLYEAEYNKERFGVDYNIDDILKVFYAEKKKSYRLEISLKPVKAKKAGDVLNLIDCHIYLTDEDNHQQEIKLCAQEKAVYLLFVLHSEGIPLSIFPKNESDKISQSKVAYNQIRTLCFRLQERILGYNYSDLQKIYITDITPIRAKIRAAISNITANKKYLEQFSIEGQKGAPFKIEAANDDHRDSIIEAFGLKDALQKYGLK